MRITLSALTLIITGFFFMTTASAQEGWIIKNSKHSVQETADKLVAIIDRAPPTLFARVDHAAGAADAGLELPESTMVMFGAPAIGTPIMQQNMKAGLDLPIRVLIWDDNGQTKIGYLDPQALKARYEIAGAEKAFEGMAGALKKFTDGAAGE
ncbi:MAG: DUF302 domain-containing protein [Pseudomonadota bacterium]